jgi:crotonobetainyl-CoA:carnitine CoA-transferase CaiB-like acyl-CoA transferase
MSLLDTTTSVLANQAMNYLVSGKSPTRLGNAHPNIVPYQEFATADGHLIVAVGNDAQFLRLCEILGAPELAGDTRYATNEARVTNRAALIPLLARRIRAFRRDDLLATLENAGVPAGPVNTVAQVFEEPQVIHRGMRIDLPTGDGTTVPSVRSPIAMSASPLVYERASPQLGQDTDAVLAGLGYAESEIARMREAGVVG